MIPHNQIKLAKYIYENELAKPHTYEMDGNDFEWSEMLVGYKAYGHMGVICAGIDFAIVVGLPWSKDIAYNMKCIRCISQRRINTKSKHPGSNLDVWLSSKIICCKFCDDMYKQYPVIEWLRDHDKEKIKKRK